jgi:hypothetical protein
MVDGGWWSGTAERNDQRASYEQISNNQHSTASGSCPFLNYYLTSTIQHLLVELAMSADGNKEECVWRNDTKV